MLASIASSAEHAGYPLLFALIMAESAGVPLPGETALIAAGVLASTGKLEIELVIVLAAVAAILGDNIGYLVSRHYGRSLLERPGPFHRQRLMVIEKGEPFFDRHGPKAVFFGRWIFGLRVWASWLAGANRMPWRSFAFWNATGGSSWAVSVGLAGYFIGHGAEEVISAFGLVGITLVVLAALLAYLLHRRSHPGI